MRFLILGLVIGAFLLQSMATLPLADSVAWMFGCGLTALLALILSARKSTTARLTAMVLMLSIGIMLGFGYAHWRANGKDVMLRLSGWWPVCPP